MDTKDLRGNLNKRDYDTSRKTDHKPSIYEPNKRQKTTYYYSCNRCFQKGHTESNCNVDIDIYCRKCKIYGHCTRNCLRCSNCGKIHNIGECNRNRNNNNNNSNNNKGTVYYNPQNLVL